MSIFNPIKPWGGVIFLRGKFKFKLFLNDLWHESETSAWVLYCKFAGDLQNTFLEEHLWGLVLCFISFVLVQVINSTFYWLVFIIYRPEFVHWSKTFLKAFFILYIFRIIFRMLAVIKAPIIFWFQSLVKQMFVEIAKAIPHRCPSEKIIWSTPAINKKRNNFINNR